MKLMERLLTQPLIARIRRNHALEHATIHVLSARVKGVAMVGRSDAGGFYLYGDVNTDAVTQAAEEALRRMRAGEANLALHPNCGTNFVAAGIIGGLAAVTALTGARGARAKAGRLPLVFALTTLALIFAQPVGLAAQQHITTLGDPGPLQIASITRRQNGGITVHRVATTS